MDTYLLESLLYIELLSISVYFVAIPAGSKARKLTVCDEVSVIVNS